MNEVISISYLFAYCYAVRGFLPWQRCFNEARFSNLGYTYDYLNPTIQEKMSQVIQIEVIVEEDVFGVARVQNNGFIATPKNDQFNCQMPFYNII